MGLLGVLSRVRLRVRRTYDLFDFRPHRGKYLPPGTPERVAYDRGGIPRFYDFLRPRGKLDPKQVFVNDYWRTHFGTPRPGSAPH